MLVPTGMAQLHAPAGCPDLLKLILESCCQRSPENRISFAEIIQRLEESVSQLFAHSNPGYSFAAAASCSSCSSADKCSGEKWNRLFKFCINFPTDLFTILEPKHPSIGVSKPNKSLQSTEFQALKLWFGLSGSPPQKKEYLQKAPENAFVSLWKKKFSDFQ